MCFVNKLGVLYMSAKLMVMNKNDSVATAVLDLVQGDTIEVQVADKIISLKLLEKIPFGHKVALRDIAANSEVLKYGQVIGTTNKDVKQGQHVHVHNTDSKRGRGDIHKD